MKHGYVSTSRSHPWVYQQPSRVVLDPDARDCAIAPGFPVQPQTLGHGLDSLNLPLPAALTVIADVADRTKQFRNSFAFLVGMRVDRQTRRLVRNGHLVYQTKLNPGGCWRTGPGWQY